MYSSLSHHSRVVGRARHHEHWGARVCVLPAHAALLATQVVLPATGLGGGYLGFAALAPILPADELTIIVDESAIYIISAVRLEKVDARVRRRPEHASREVDARFRAGPQRRGEARRLHVEGLVVVVDRERGVGGRRVAVAPVAAPRRSVVFVVIRRRALVRERRYGVDRHQIAVAVPHVHQALAGGLAVALARAVPVDGHEAGTIRGFAERPAVVAGRGADLAVERRVAPARSAAPVRRRGGHVVVVCCVVRGGIGAVLALPRNLGIVAPERAARVAVLLADKGDAVERVLVLAVGLERVPREPAVPTARSRDLRQGTPARGIGEVDPVAVDAAIALGRRVRDAVAVEVVAEGVSCSKKDKQCGKDKAEADPVAGCAVGFQGRRLRTGRLGHEHRCRSRRRQRFLPGSNAPNSAVSLALISSVPTGLDRRQRRADAAVSGRAAVARSCRRAARRG